jgi:hypothetical protein
VTLHHLGLAHYDRGEYDTALNWYRLASENDSNEPKVNGSIAIAKLAMGKLREGLHEFEVIHPQASQKADHDSGITAMERRNLTGKTVILAHEQGFGDTLQFIRFAPLLKIAARKTDLLGPGSL